MNKKILIPLVVVIILLLAGVGVLYFNLHKQRKENADMEQLAALDKKEMENEYQQFADQYSEMKTQINNDSIVAQLTAEQEKTQRLTVRAVLRSYVIQIDSLNRANEHLTAENTRIRGQYAEANRQIEGLNTEKASLSEKVAIAAQLDATGISMTALNKRGKSTDKLKKAKRFMVSFTIARNVTAQSGMKTVYIRVTTPTGALLGGAGSFNYENRSLACSAKRSLEYTGKETPMSLYLDIDQSLEGGTFNVSIFADGNMIGSRSFSFQ